MCLQRRCVSNSGLMRNLRGEINILMYGLRHFSKTFITASLLNPESTYTAPRRASMESASTFGYSTSIQKWCDDRTDMAPLCRNNVISMIRLTLALQIRSRWKPSETVAPFRLFCWRLSRPGWIEMSGSSIHFKMMFLCYPTKSGWVGRILVNVIGSMYFTISFINKENSRGQHLHFLAILMP